MNNEEVLNSLNSETKDFFNNFLSIFDRFKKNNPYKQELIMLELSCFLATLKTDKVMSDFFNKHDITYDDYSIDYELKDASKCEYFNKMDLPFLMNDIISYIKNGYFLKDKNIDINEVMPYHIFDYVINNNYTYKDFLKAILKNRNYSSIKNELNEYIYNIYKDFVSNYDVDLDKEIKKIIEEDNDKNESDDFDNDDYYRDHTPNLDLIGTDLTKKKYDINPCIGRENEFETIEEILLYPKRNKSIIIVGSSGCGKTALIEGLAYRIQNGLVPDSLKKLRIVNIMVSSLTAGTEYTGTLESKILTIVDEIKHTNNIVLVIDGIHQAIGSGKTQGNDNSVSEILKPFISSGTIRVIGITTKIEYDDYIQSDPSFKTGFKKISLTEPDRFLTYMIIDNLFESYNKLNSKNPNRCPRFDFTDYEKDIIIDWLIDSTNKKDNINQLDDSSSLQIIIDVIEHAYGIASRLNKEALEISDIKNALLKEERLYKGASERQVVLLDHLLNNNSKKKDNILVFKPKK